MRPQHPVSPVSPISARFTIFRLAFTSQLVDSLRLSQKHLFAFFNVCRQLPRGGSYRGVNAFYAFSPANPRSLCYSLPFFLIWPLGPLASLPLVLGGGVVAVAQRTHSLAIYRSSDPVRLAFVNVF